jgi:hypothetical protein
MNPCGACLELRPLVVASIAVLTIAIVGFLAFPPSAMAEVSQQGSEGPAGNRGALTVQVSNGTDLAPNSAPYEVTLQAFDGDLEVDRWTEETGPKGGVRFREIDRSPGLVYIASSAHLGVRYFADPISVFDGIEQPVLVTVYEITSDPSAIRISGDNMVILGPAGEAGTINVMQVTTVENVSDRTFVGDRGAESAIALRLPLPDQAFDVEAMHAPGSLLEDPESRNLYSTLPILPGSDNLVLTYRLLYRNRQYLLAKTYAYPAEVVRLLVPEGISSELDHSWVSAVGTEVAGVAYETFELVASDTPNLTVTALLTDLPVSSGDRSKDLERWFRYGAIGVGFLAPLAALGYGFIWSRTRRDEAESGMNPLWGESESSIVDALTDLDADFDAGSMPEDAYRTARAEHVQMLRRQLEGEGSE